MVINPNSAKEYINNADNLGYFHQFFESIKYDNFRHIQNIEITFTNPITVISGSNKSGKTTILLSIACSHYNFKKRNPINGNIERTKWGDVMKFTSFDIQNQDWTYYVKYREGTRILNRRGQRKHQTSKWNGVAKKESQIGAPTQHNRNGGRNVILIDLQRIIPNRNNSASIFNKSKNNLTPTPLNPIKTEYLSYIFEDTYNVSSIAKIGDKEIFKYTSSHNYSSYNTASGEDVLTKIISDIVDANDYSLILIEELEIGLHPKIQRRLMDIIYIESKRTKKQFIITTHSSTVLSSVVPNSRIFINNRNNLATNVIKGISINAALSKMDTLAYPLVNIFVEDDISRLIVNKIIAKIIESPNLKGFGDLINIITVGPAKKTYQYYKAHADTFDKKIITCGHACILDGDQRQANYLNDEDPHLFFHYSNYSPEKMLLQEFLTETTDTGLEYHLNNTNPHIFFDKMIEAGHCTTKDEAFNLCWNVFSQKDYGSQHINQFETFLIDRCKAFSNCL